MSAQIKEALAALDIARSGIGPDRSRDEKARDAITVIRSALEAAQQEAEAWTTVRKWMADPKVQKRLDDQYLGQPHVLIDEHDVLACGIDHGELAVLHESKTIQELAAWCLEDMAK